MTTPAPSGDQLDAHFSKKRMLDKDPAPAKLWTFALEAVLDQLADQEPEQLVQLIEKNEKLRRLMVEKIVRKPHPASQLGDTDIIEVFRVSADADMLGIGKVWPGHYDDWCMTVGELPRRVRTALKEQFHMHAAGTEENDKYRMADHGELWCSPDGRICFECTTQKESEDPAQSRFRWVEDAYLAVVEGAIEEEQVPDWEDVPHARWDNVDVMDKFPFLVKDTLLCDAYDHHLNQSGENRIRALVRQEFRSAFCGEEASPLTNGITTAFMDTLQRRRLPLGAAWVRKPKMRVWVSIM